MKLYRMEGTGHVGPGDVIGIDERQFGARRAQLELIEQRGTRFVCRALAALQFKAGEEIELSYAPPKGLAEIMVPVGETAPAKPSPAKAEPQPKPKRQPKRPGPATTPALSVNAGKLAAPATSA